MSRWGIVTASLAALVFLMLPLFLAQVSYSGRMARWDERVRRRDERYTRRALEDWTPPLWYPPVVASTSVTWMLVVWLRTHDVAQVGVAVVTGIVPTAMAVVARRRARERGRTTSHH